MTHAGFDLKPGEHPITPVMLYDAPLAQRFAARLLEEGIYVIGFFFPVVPKGQARIRTQMSARTPASTSTVPSPPSPGSGRNWVS
jgi:glycine C-acetyltransferase